MFHGHEHFFDHTGDEFPVKANQVYGAVGWSAVSDCGIS